MEPGYVVSGLRKFVATDLKSRWSREERVFDIRTPHALSQVAGYLKYVQNEAGSVYFRGQNKLYMEGSNVSMRPALYRGVESRAGAAKIEKEYSRFVCEANELGLFLNDTPRHARRPILQHYGVRTPWLDLVDNVWSALWFACHTCRVSGKYGEYIHYEPSELKDSYIILMQFGLESPRKGCPGRFETDNNAYVIDLRQAAPSLYLRPHSQHGILARRKELGDEAYFDYCNYVAAVLRIPTQSAFEWLGKGVLSSAHFMFPPPHYDKGYEVLLKTPLSKSVIGSIVHVGV